MEVTGFSGRGEYTAGHIQLWLKVGPIASLARFHVVRTEVSYHVDQATIQFGFVLHVVLVRQNIMHFTYPIGQF